MFTAAVTWTLLMCSPTYGCNVVESEIESQVQCFQMAVLAVQIMKVRDPKLTKWALEVHKGEFKCIPINEELK